jgi:hypothetical protein
MNDERRYIEFFYSTPHIYQPTKLIKYINMSTIPSKKAALGGSLTSNEMRRVQNLDTYEEARRKQNFGIASNRMSDKEAEEILFGKIEDINPNDIDQVLKEARRGKQCRIPKHFEISYIEKDSSLQWKINQLQLNGFHVYENKIKTNILPKDNYNFPREKNDVKSVSTKKQQFGIKIELTEQKKKSFFQRIFKSH